MANFRTHNFPKLLLLSLIVTNILEIISKEMCVVYKTRNQIHANCSYRNLTKIPNNLGNKIQALDLSGNEISEISTNDLQHYKHLITLKLNKYGLEPKFCKIDPFVFQNLHFLQTLELFSNDFGPEIKLNFPPSLKVLRVSRSNLHDKNFDISYLRNLVHLSAFGVGFTKFPEINQLTPLKYLDLRYNDIDHFPTEVIAGFCKLKQFYFNQIYLNDNTKDCTCSQLIDWMKKANISGLDPPNFMCSSEKKCDTPGVTPLMWDNFNACINRYTSESLYYEGFFVFLAAVIVIVFLMYYIARKKNQPPKLVVPNAFEDEDEDERYEEEIEEQKQNK